MRNNSQMNSKPVTFDKIKKGIADEFYPQYSGITLSH